MKIDIEKTAENGKKPTKQASKTIIWAIVVKVIAVLALIASCCVGFYLTTNFSDGATKLLYFAGAFVVGLVLMAVLMLYANQATDVAKIKEYFLDDDETE